MHNTLYIVSPQKRRPLIITMNNYDPNYIILLLLPALNLDTFAFVLSSLPITSSLVFIHHKLYCLITSYFIAPLQTFCFIITTLLFPKHTLCISARNHISCPSECPSLLSAKNYLSLFPNCAKVPPDHST